MVQDTLSAPAWHTVLQQGWSPVPYSPDQSRAPQSQAHLHSLLPAGCTETLALCRSCHSPCPTALHRKGRRPACVKSSWDRLFYHLNFWKWPLSPRFTICQEGIYHLTCQSPSRSLVLPLQWRCLRTTCGTRIYKKNIVNSRDAAWQPFLCCLCENFFAGIRSRMAGTTGAQVKGLRPRVTGVTIRLWFCRGLRDTLISHHNNVSSDTCYQTAFWGTTIIYLLALAMLIFIINMEWLLIIYMNTKYVYNLCVFYLKCSEYTSNLVLHPIVWMHFKKTSHYICYVM